MNDTNKLRATITRSGDTFHIRASKGDQSLTEEDYIQLQILEYQVRYYPDRVTLDTPIILGD